LTWNCNGALRKKFSYLLRFDADILVIQECEKPSSVVKGSPEYREFSSNSLWTGKVNNRGLGIFAKHNLPLERLDWNHMFRDRVLQWFLPVRIDGTNDIVAVWNHHAEAEAFSYIGQFWQFIQNNRGLLADSIICGDFNSNSIWDKWDRWWNHSDCVRELSQMSIHSVYHSIHGISQGEEVQKTFYLHRKPDKGYHIDFIFAKDELISRTKRLDYGDFSEWKAKSDHVPIVWEF
jgi:exonuclease III